MCAQYTGSISRKKAQNTKRSAMLDYCGNVMITSIFAKFKSFAKVATSGPEIFGQ